MADKANLDKFANYAIITCLESAPNTLTFKKLETGISITEKVAWIIHRIEYFLGAIAAAQFNADQDAQVFGLSVSNAFATPQLTENTILDLNSLIRVDLGAAATGSWERQPYTKDFTQLPSGGLLVPPTPLYLFNKGTSLVAASTVTARLHYTTRALVVDEYWELVESRRVLES